MHPVQFYKSIADDTRLASLLLIQREGEICVCELTTALALSQPKVSRHLAQLRKAELLADRRQGQWVFYRINPDLNDWAKQVLADTLSANSDYLAASVARLEAMGSRPERAINCC
jgi:ArsR family transcriptional regulator